MSNSSHKRAHNTAFALPATPAPTQSKAKKLSTPSSLAQDSPVNDENASSAGRAQDVNITDGVTTNSRPARGATLQEVVEIQNSGGSFRPKLTLGDETAMEYVHEWEDTPFVIWEDMDVVAERMDLGDEKMHE